MKITWLGHSCFKVEKNNFSVILDPYAAGSVPGLLPVHEQANMVLCSHEHSDHNGRSAVELVDTSTGNPFSVTIIDTWHDDVKGGKRGPNRIHILDDGENRIAHLGDLGCTLEQEQIELLKGLDALLIPVGGFFTIDAQQAAELIAILKPEIAVPMHYRNDNYGFDIIGTLAEFTEKMDCVTTLPGSSLETAETYPAQVVVLHPQNRA